MNLNFIPATEAGRDTISALYTRAFPEEERIAYPMLEIRAQYEDAELLTVLDGEQPIGMLFLVQYQDLVLILYFAVLEELRNQGYGAAILCKLAERYAGCRLFLDIEAVDAAQPGHAMRARRRNFYLRNRFSSTNRTYTWKGMTFEILSYGGDVTREECRALIREFKAKMPT